MHFHSRYSDGACWPAELAAAARDAGLEAVSLSDHDTLAGVPEFLAAARGAGLVAWPAVEIDCYDALSGYRSELLAYFPRGSYAATDELLAGIRAERRRMVAGLFDNAAAFFNKPGLSFRAYEDAELAAQPAGRPAIKPADIRYGKTDLFRALIASGVLGANTDYREFKKAYLKTGLLGPASFPKPSVEQACATVLRDGGFLSLPHVGHCFDDDPKRMKKEKARFDALIARFKGFGLSYLELYAYGGKHEQALNELVWIQAQAMGLGLSYGSDDHGPEAKKARIGSFYGDFEGFPV
ncbi:MAG TPA: hypothetical protein DCG47_11700 [Spirochaetaceae bacterium]|nr:hypothetical protein [Spirochaetaceae bacterium]